MTTLRTKTAQRGFSLIEVLLVLAIISVMAAMVINAFSNATQDSRNVVARQQQAALQSAVSNWATSLIGTKKRLDPDSDGTPSIYEFSINMTQARYNFKNWWTSPPTVPLTSRERLDMVKGYLDEGTVAHFVENTPSGEDDEITSAAMRKTGSHVKLGTWADGTYPKVDLYLAN